MCERERSSPNSSSLLRENDLRYFNDMHMNWSLIDNLSLSLSQKTRKPPRNKRSKESTVFRGRKVAALPTLKSPGAHALGDVVAAAFINSDRKESTLSSLSRIVAKSSTDFTAPFGATNSSKSA